MAITGHRFLYTV